MLILVLQKVRALQRYLCFETVNLLHKEAGVQIVQCLAKLSSFAFAGFYRAICAPNHFLGPISNTISNLAKIVYFYLYSPLYLYFLDFQSC